jgi:hypothetical protein
MKTGLRQQIRNAESLAEASADFQYAMANLTDASAKTKRAWKSAYARRCRELKGDNGN